MRDFATHVSVEPQKSSRDMSLDIVKGFTVVLMVLAHAVAFFHDGSSSIMGSLQRVGDTLSFTSFLFLSGAAVYFAYLKKNKPFDPPKLLKRTLYLVIGYYAVAIISTLSSMPTSPNGIIDHISKIALFITVPGYTEFLVPFIIFSLLIIPFRKVFQLFAASPVLSLLVGLGAFYLGTQLYEYSLPAPFSYYKPLLSGEEGKYAFPLLQYFIVFLFGLNWGKFAVNVKTQTVRKRAAVQILTFFVVFLALSQSLLLNSNSFIHDLSLRWPPSLAFLAIGLTYVFFSLYITQTWNESFATRFLSSLGRQVFTMYIFHIVILQLYALNHGPRFDNLWTPIILFIILLVASYFLSSAYHILTTEEKKGGPSIREQMKQLEYTETRTKLNFSFMVPVIIFILIFIGLRGYITFGTNEESKEEGDTFEISVEDEQVAKSTWWDNNSSWYKVLKIENNMDETLGSGEWVSIRFNHNKLVTSGQSLENGNDLKLVYMIDGIYQQVPLSIDGANKANTRIIFQTVGAIEEGKSDLNYSLYYGDLLSDKAQSANYNNQNTNLQAKLSISQPISHPLVASASREWVLRGKELSPLDKELEIFITPRDQQSTNLNLNYKVLGTNVKGKMTLTSTGIYQAKINPDLIQPGIYRVQAEGGDDLSIKSSITTFKVSYPLYVVWSVDWEGYDVNNSYLDRMAVLSDLHKMPITHFYNPRIYVASDVPSSRQNYMDNWVKERRKKGDQIELHLHGFPDMISATGVRPKFSPKWSNYKDGKDITMSAYNTSEMEQILRWSITQFERRGLGTPKMYRSGGWFTNLDTLNALENTGFTVDSSGRTTYTWGSAQIKGFWDLRSTTKPYHPSTSNQNLERAPNFNLLEMPNNGADSWSYSAQEMISRFDDNYKKEPLDERQTVTYLSHPHWFNVDEPKMQQLLDYIDKYSYKDDNGPVKYVTMQEASKGWL